MCLSKWEAKVYHADYCPFRNSMRYMALYELFGTIHHDEEPAGIRDHVVQAVELKFNCFFLMPVVDSFPTRLREELESAYDDDIDEVFDVTAVRNALESRLKALESELHQVRHTAHHVIGAQNAAACRACLWQT